MKISISKVQTAKVQIGASCHLVTLSCFLACCCQVFAFICYFLFYFVSDLSCGFLLVWPPLMFSYFQLWLVSTSFDYLVCKTSASLCPLPEHLLASPVCFTSQNKGSFFGLISEPTRVCVWVLILQFMTVWKSNWENEIF